MHDLIDINGISIYTTRQTRFDGPFWVVPNTKHHKHAWTGQARTLNGKLSLWHPSVSWPCALLCPVLRFYWITAFCLHKYNYKQYIYIYICVYMYIWIVQLLYNIDLYMQLHCYSLSLTHSLFILCSHVSQSFSRLWTWVWLNKKRIALVLGVVKPPTKWS